MPRVTVQPAGIEFEADPGEVLMAAARRHGYRWPTTCDMCADCSVCHVLTLSDPAALAGSHPREEETLGLIRHRYRDAASGALRLACVATVEADVTVQRRGVRPAVQPNAASTAGS